MSEKNIYEIMQIIAKKRGAIVSGGRIDDDKDCLQMECAKAYNAKYIISHLCHIICI